MPPTRPLAALAAPPTSSPFAHPGQQLAEALGQVLPLKAVHLRPQLLQKRETLLQLRQPGLGPRPGNGHRLAQAGKGAAQAGNQQQNHRRQHPNHQPDRNPQRQFAPRTTPAFRHTPLNGAHGHIQHKGHCPAHKKRGKQATQRAQSPKGHRRVLKQPVQGHHPGQHRTQQQNFVFSFLHPGLLHRRGPFCAAAPFFQHRFSIGYPGRPFQTKPMGKL